MQEKYKNFARRNFLDDRILNVSLHMKNSSLLIRNIYLGTKHVIQYDDQLSRPFNMTYTNVTSNSVKLLFYFNETNPNPNRRIQKLEVC